MRRCDVAISCVRRLLLVIPALLCIALVALLMHGSSSPEKTVDTAICAFEKGDTEALLAMIDPDRLSFPYARENALMWLAVQRRAIDARGGLESIELLMINRTEHKAYATIRLHLKDGTMADRTMAMIERDGHWYFE